MINDLRVKPEDIGKWFKKLNLRTWHFVENDSLMARCSCGEHSFIPERGEVSSTRPEGKLNKQCLHEAERKAKQLESRMIDRTRAELRELGEEVKDVIDSGIRAAIILCDPIIMENMLDAYKMITDARLVEYLRELDLYNHVETMVLIRSGEINQVTKQSGTDFLMANDRLDDAIVAKIVIDEYAIVAKTVKDKDA